jgi:CBS domain containing-hemolysin-like protein
MTGTVGDVLLGVLVVVVVTAGTGYFVAQQFVYTAVDRSRVRAGAAAGDRRWERVRAITDRTSFTLSGAQLGITVTTLVVGFVAEPMIGAGIGELLGGAGVPQGTGLAAGTTLALLLCTLVQMVFGELLPKNLAISRPEPVARALALSTRIYLAVFGWLVWLFDRAAGLLLRLARIERVEDLESAATARDLKHILAESRRSGDLPADLYAQLARTLEFQERTAEHAMTPRALVTAVGADEPLARVVELMALGRSRFPVLGTEDVIGVVCLRDVLAVGAEELSALRVGDVARGTVLVPFSLDLPGVLLLLREAGEEFACVVDEYGGLAGVITTEDLAEELVGEIADEYSAEEVSPTRLGPVAEGAGTGAGEAFRVPGSLHIDEAERLLGRTLPQGRYETVGGLIIHELHRLPRAGDLVRVGLPGSAAGGAGPLAELTMLVEAVEHHVPSRVELRARTVDGAGTGTRTQARV